MHSAFMRGQEIAADVSNVTTDPAILIAGALVVGVLVRAFDSRLSAQGFTKQNFEEADLNIAIRSRRRIEYSNRLHTRPQDGTIEE